MIQITQIDSMDDLEYDHVKCPQCHTRLCGKPRGARVCMIHFSRIIKASPLMFTCPKCRHTYLVSNIAE